MGTFDAREVNEGNWGKHPSRARQSLRLEKTNPPANFRCAMTPPTHPQSRNTHDFHCAMTPTMSPLKRPADLAMFKRSAHRVRETQALPNGIYENSLQLRGRRMTPIDMQLRNNFLAVGQTRIHRIPQCRRRACRGSARRIKLIQAILLFWEALNAVGHIRTFLRKGPSGKRGRMY